MSDSDSRIADLEHDFALALKEIRKKDGEIIQLIYDLGKITSERDKLAFENKILKDQLKTFPEIIRSQGDFLTGRYFDLWASHQSFADKAEACIDNQSQKLDKYQKGPKKKAEISNQAWTLAKQYFLEEIPKNKNLKKAREIAALRAGIEVEERQLIKKLPKPK